MLGLVNSFQFIIESEYIKRKARKNPETLVEQMVSPEKWKTYRMGANIGKSINDIHK